MTEEERDRAAAAIKSGRGWMKFLAVLSIIYGVLYCLTIVGAVIGWIALWMGILLLRAGEQAERLERDWNETTLAEYIGHISKCFRIAGIAQLVLLILTVLGIIIAGICVLLLSSFVPPAPVPPRITINSSLTEEVEDIIIYSVNKEKNTEEVASIILSMPTQENDIKISGGKIVKLEFEPTVTLGRTEKEVEANISLTKQDWDVFKQALKKAWPEVEVELDKKVQTINSDAWVTDEGKNIICEYIKTKTNQALPKLIEPSKQLSSPTLSTQRITDVSIINWHFGEGDKNE